MSLEQYLTVMSGLYPYYTNYKPFI